MRLHPADRVSAENIERLPIAVTGTNQMVPLDQIATITMGKGPSAISHKDGQRIMAVSANVQGLLIGARTGAYVARNRLRPLRPANAAPR